MNKFDYIVVGGGSAGCVLANRLSEQQDVSVCLLEAGPKESKKGRVPLFLHALMGDSSDTHDVGGELSVAGLKHIEKPTQVLLDAADECGYPVVEDFNTGNVEGFAPYHVNQVNGERCSSARAFIEPALKRSNLTVITGTHASKVLFDDNKCAVAVEYVQDGKTEKVACNKEIILSAGTVGSAQLLLLSGVGPARQLEQHGIELVHDLPGVGENFQDHLDAGMSFHAKSGFMTPKHS